jgi:hypothetical protein
MLAAADGFKASELIRRVIEHQLASRPRGLAEPTSDLATRAKL